MTRVAADALHDFEREAATEWFGRNMEELAVTRAVVQNAIPS